MKKPLKDSFIIGFALFSMFFGAGNVIFPPYLGLESGPHWLLGFISYYIADIGLALLAMFAILRQGSPEKVTSRIGKVPSVLLMCAIVLCIGPMLAIPRTAATTFETSVTPLVSGVSPVLFSVLFAGEQLTMRLVAGFALIFTSIVLSETHFSFLLKPYAHVRKRRER